jgi:hypothetical protein
LRRLHASAWRARSAYAAAMFHIIRFASGSVIASTMARCDAGHDHAPQYPSRDGRPGIAAQVAILHRVRGGTLCERSGIPHR